MKTKTKKQIEKTIAYFESRGVVLRPGQLQAFVNSFEGWDSDRRPLTILPTGYGKTLVMAFIAHVIHSLSGKTTLIVCGNRKLAAQTSESLQGLLPQLVVGHHFSGSRLQNNNSNIVVTLPESSKRLSKKFSAGVGCLLFDEAHHSSADTWVDVLTTVNDVCVGGLTATPVRSDKESLARVYDMVTVNMSLSEAAEDGYLIKPTIRHYEVGGDKSKMFKTVLKYAELGKVLVFCEDVKHAKACYSFMEGFKVGKGRSSLVYNGLSDEELADNYERFESGESRIMFNVAMLQEGFNDPEVVTVVIMKKVRSGLVFAQQVGRVTRPVKHPVGSHAAARKHWISQSAKPETFVVHFDEDIAAYEESEIAEILKDWEPRGESGVGTSREPCDRTTEEWELNLEACTQVCTERDLFSNKILEVRELTVAGVEAALQLIADRMSDFSEHYAGMSKRKLVSVDLKGLSAQDLADLILASQGGDRCASDLLARYMYAHKNGWLQNKEKRDFSVEFRGVMYPSKEACYREFGTSSETVDNRRRKGATFQEALSAYLDEREGRVVKFRGKSYQSRPACCKAFEVAVTSITYAMRKGGTFEECLEAYLTKRAAATVEFRGKVYPNRTTCCREFGLAVGNVMSEVSDDRTFQEALEVKLEEQKNRRVKFRGKTYQSRRDCCKTLGVDSSYIRRREVKGMSFQDALEDYFKCQLGAHLTFRGKSYPSRAVCCRTFKIKQIDVSQRVSTGMTFEEALEDCLKSN